MQHIKMQCAGTLMVMLFFLITVRYCYIVLQVMLSNVGGNAEMKMLMTCKSQVFQSPFCGRDSDKPGQSDKCLVAEGREAISGSLRWSYLFFLAPTTAILSNLCSQGSLSGLC